jgi:ABC-type nitrate/sulfonate/bicarbonate transport system substrate-binding protein
MGQRRKYAPHGEEDDVTRMPWLIGIAGLALLASASAVRAQTELKVIVFPGLSNLMQIVAQAHGYYAKRGLAVELINTPNSTELRNGLAEGRYHIAHAAIDNAVAQVETAKVDLFVFMGGNNGNNSLFVRPEINSYEDIRGKTVVVDAPNTAFALLLYKMLQEKGLSKSDYKVNPVGGTDARLKAMTSDPAAVAGMLSPPQSVSGQRAGLKNFGTAVSVIGPYQSDAGWVLRSWGQANADTLVRYIQANVEGIRWALNPANRTALVSLLAERFKMSPDVVEEVLRGSVDQKGFAPDAQFDMKGFENTLRLRADMLGTWGGNAPPPAGKYLDLSYYQRALAGL